MRRAAPRLMAALDRAAQMCARILDYAQAGEPGFRPETLSLAAPIDEAGAALTADGGGARRGAGDHVPRELVVRADRLQLFRVIQNLGRNALEAMPDGGAVRFTAAARDGETAIDVVDTGPGIPERARRAVSALRRFGAPRRRRSRPRHRAREHAPSRRQRHPDVHRSGRDPYASRSPPAAGRGGGDSMRHFEGLTRFSV